MNSLLDSGRTPPPATIEPEETHRTSTDFANWQVVGTAVLLRNPQTGQLGVIRLVGPQDARFSREVQTQTIQGAHGPAYVVVLSDRLHLEVDATAGDLTLTEAQAQLGPVSSLLPLAEGSTEADPLTVAEGNTDVLDTPTPGD